MLITLSQTLLRINQHRGVWPVCLMQQSAGKARDWLALPRAAGGPPTRIGGLVHDGPLHGELLCGLDVIYLYQILLHPIAPFKIFLRPAAFLRAFRL